MMSKVETPTRPHIRRPAKRERKQAVDPVRTAEVPSPFEEMERLFETLVPRGWLRGTPWDWSRLGELGHFSGDRMPRVDVIDRDSEVVVRAGLPGVDKKDLEISLTDDTVTLKATTCHEKRDEKGDFHCCEISRGAFTRTLSLPAGVDCDAAKATFNDGLLELVLPKVAPAPRRRIEVQ